MPSFDINLLCPLLSCLACALSTTSPTPSHHPLSSSICHVLFCFWLPLISLWQWNCAEEIFSRIEPKNIISRRTSYHSVLLYHRTSSQELEYEADYVNYLKPNWTKSGGCAARNPPVSATIELIRQKDHKRIIFLQFGLVCFFSKLNSVSATDISYINR